jgi:putative phage-type endonuclease
LTKLIYTDEELPQRSDEWLELRGSKIGGSDVAAVLGQNPWEDAYKLWQYKTGKIAPKKFTKAMERGTILESEALEKVSEQLSSDYDNLKIEQFFVIDPDFEFASASYDGVDIDNKFIVELKCPSSAVNFKSVFEDGIPGYYYPQVQWQLMIAKKTWNIDKAYFCSYYPEGCYITNFEIFKEEQKTLAILEIDYDEQYCNDAVQVVKKFEEFLKYDYWDEKEYAKELNKFTELHYPYFEI